MQIGRNRFKLREKLFLGYVRVKRRVATNSTITASNYTLVASTTSLTTKFCLQSIILNEALKD